MSGTVLLTSTNWWPSSAHLAIALKGAGLRVAAVYPRMGHPLAKTGAVSLRYLYRPTAPLNSLAKAIRDSTADWVLPCDDRATAHLHRLHRKASLEGTSSLVTQLERSLGSPQSFDVVRSRSKLLRVAAAEGAAVPDSKEINSVEQLRELQAVWGFPWVMKMDGSWGGLGVKTIHSLQDAETCFRRMRKPLGTLPMLKRIMLNRDGFWMESWWNAETPGLTIQRYIEGRPANCVVFCIAGKVIVGMAAEVVAAQSLMGPATAVRLVEGQAMLRAASAVAARLELSGFHGFDFMLEERTGTAYLIELNPRCAMPCHLRPEPDRDLVGALARTITGVAHNPPRMPREGDVISYFPQAWLADPKNEGLHTGYHDVPWGEPQLVKELLRIPWPDRNLLARASDHYRKQSFKDRSNRALVFSPDTIRTNIHSREIA